MKLARSASPSPELTIALAAPVVKASAVPGLRDDMAPALLKVGLVTRTPSTTGTHPSTSNAKPSVLTCGADSG